MNKYIWAIIVLLSFMRANAQNHVMPFPYNSYVHTVTFPDHKIRFQLQEANELPKIITPTKQYYWYSSNKINITQGGYSGKLLNGAYSAFYLNNNLKEQGNFKLGLKTGEWKIWTIQGMLSEITNFKDGIIHGVFYRYDILGGIAEIANFKNGKFNGKRQQYLKADSIINSQYKDGVLKLLAPNWLQRKFKKTPKIKVNKT